MNGTTLCRLCNRRFPHTHDPEDFDLARANAKVSRLRTVPPPPTPPQAGRGGLSAKEKIGLALTIFMAAGVLLSLILVKPGPIHAAQAADSKSPATPPVKPADEPPAPKKPLPPARPDDERIKAAQAKKNALESSERALLKATGLNLGDSFTQLQAAIDQMKPADLAAEKGAVGELRRVVLELRGVARDILAKEPEYKRLLSIYHDELKAAPGAFVPAAAVFEQMAEEEPIKEFKDRYKHLGKSLRDLAKVMERRAADLAGDEKEVAEAYRYVAAAEKYLTSLGEWLASYPSFESGVERQKQVQELRAFIRYFRELDSAFDKFNKKVTQPPDAAG